MLDAVHLERMGVPAALVVTEPFLRAAKANAAAHGLPDLPMVVVPHDYLVEDDTVVRRKIEAIVDEVLERLFVRPSDGSAGGAAPAGRSEVS